MVCRVPPASPDAEGRAPRSTTAGATVTGVVRPSARRRRSRPKGSVVTISKGPRAWMPRVLPTMSYRACRPPPRPGERRCGRGGRGPSASPVTPDGRRSRHRPGPPGRVLRSPARTATVAVPPTSGTSGVIARETVPAPRVNSRVTAEVARSATMSVAKYRSSGMPARCAITNAATARSRAPVPRRLKGHQRRTGRLMSSRRGGPARSRRCGRGRRPRPRPPPVRRPPTGWGSGGARRRETAAP